MVITHVSANELMSSSREALGLSGASDGIIDDAMLAASLRRAAGILCPCSLSTLVTAVLESLQYLFEEGDAMGERVAAAAEGLIIGGDLLELSQVTIHDPTAKGTWVFSAPPSFIVRPGGSIFLAGIVPDESTPLPASLNTRITYEGFARLMTPQLGENLPSVLRELGLRELSTSAWLKAPKAESAAALRDNMFRRLAEQPASGAVTNISILDPHRSVDYYSGRWVDPTHETGAYVARRPQAYGAPLWGFANLEGGTVTRFLDFPLKSTRWRGCDTAWYLQMAIDHGRETPQLYRRRMTPDGAFLDFFSPLPLWAHRRFAVLGRPAPREKCLICYWIPERELASEEAFLQERLWLARREKFEQREEA
jgi:hypothetical protein